MLSGCIASSCLTLQQLDSHHGDGYGNDYNPHFEFCMVVKMKVMTRIRCIPMSDDEEHCDDDGGG